MRSISSGALTSWSTRAPFKPASHNASILGAVKTLDRPEAERERFIDELPDRLDPAMSALGIIFLLVVLGQGLAEEESAVAGWLEWVGWGLWVAFLSEFLLRLVVAPSRARFMRKNWWQLVFLALPFLRFLRLLRPLLRGGRVVSSAVRAARSSQRTLTGRLGWLTAVTTIVILAGSQLLYEFGGISSYGDALYAAALATISGEPTHSSTGFGRVLDVVLSIYSIVVFASLAGMLGAFFLETRTRENIS